MSVTATVGDSKQVHESFTRLAHQAWTRDHRRPVGLVELVRPVAPGRAIVLFRCAICRRTHAAYAHLGTAATFGLCPRTFVPQLVEQQPLEAAAA